MTIHILDGWTTVIALSGRTNGEAIPDGRKEGGDQAERSAALSITRVRLG